MKVMVRGKESEPHVTKSVDGKLICLVERNIAKKDLGKVEYWVWDKKKVCYVRGK